MEIRVSVRRGNALAKLNRVSEAVQEYERALKLDPQNETIQKDLDVLRRGENKWLKVVFILICLTFYGIISEISRNNII